MEQARTATRTKKGIALAVALAAALTVGSPAGNASAGPRARAQSELLSLHNQARKAEHAKSLRRDSDLARYAKRHSKAMAEAGTLFHTKNLAKPLRGRNWSIAGENVGMTFTNDGLDAAVQDLQEAFMASPEHRENVLRKSFDHAAVGMYEADGKVWVTVVFYG